MGTNYYIDRDPPCCPTCGKPTSQVHHIGKSSAGWAFLFRGYPDEGLTSAKAWFEFLKGKQIVDEYGIPHSLERFQQMVDGKRGDRIAYNDSQKKMDPDGHPVAFYEFS